MTKAEVQDLRCTTTVRRGDVCGMVVEATEFTVKILWDDSGRVPTTYSRRSEALNEVAIKRQGDRILYTDPVAHRFRARRRTR